MLAVVSVSCGNKTASVTVDTSRHRSVYWWKTTFNPDENELAFIRDHSIDRIYLRVFDVDWQENYVLDTARTVPVATVDVKSERPEDVEIVPAVFITLRGLAGYEDHEDELAALIVKRTLNICSYNDLGPINEVQFDCDWTESTRDSYVRLCDAARRILHEKGILLSGTIRLHQVAESEYPFDKGVLMMYNTGAIKDRYTANSILSYDDVAKYLGVRARVEKFLAARKDNCSVIDVAYPTFRWTVLFYQGGNFSEIMRTFNYADYPQLERKGNVYVAKEGFDVDYHWISQGMTLRPEYAKYDEVMKVKDLVERTLGTDGSNIIYHLDSRNLSNYSSDEIEKILH